MKFFGKSSQPKEIKAVLGVLDELACNFDNEAFNLVRTRVESKVLDQAEVFAKVFREGRSPREFTVGAVGRIAGDLVGTGDFHIYRGVLNPLGPGDDLLRLHDFAADELVQLGQITEEQASEQKAIVRSDIASVG